MLEGRFRMKSLCFVLVCAAAVAAFPIDSEEEKLDRIQKYLEKYYDFKTVREKGSNTLVQKIKEMQQFLGLRVTGKVDSNTLEAIQKPRCGNPDVGEFAFFAGRPKWGKNTLTYKIVNYTPDMKEADVEREIEKAFEVWSRVTPLTFTKSPDDRADIIISFASREHGDFNAFDGPGGTVAHAYAPGIGIGGDAHFDEDEKWTNGLEGSNLFFVAVHELGHSLGLFHSNDQNAVMFPFYRDPQLNQKILSQDDIEGIQQLYGPSLNPSEDPWEDDNPKESFKPNQPALPSACDPNLTFDAVTSFRGEIMFFKDKYFWRKHPQYAVIDFSIITAFWPFLPSGVDAASENDDKDEVLLFKGNQFWVVKGDSMLPGYPKPIHSLGFPRDVKKIDAAFYSADERRTYYFSSDKYWSYDEINKSMTKKPQRIRDGFPGIEGKVDAVFQQNELLYFFKGTNQYKFDPNGRRVTQVTKVNNWFPC